MVTLICLRRTKASGNASLVSSKAREATKDKQRSKVNCKTVSSISFDNKTSPFYSDFGEYYFA